jgi:integrase
MLRLISTKCSANGTAGEGSTRRSKRSINTWTAGLNSVRGRGYLGLTWNDLDLDPGTVSVSHTLEWRKGGCQFAETKRSRSRRVVKLQAWVVALLREQVPKQQEALGDVLVFRARRGGAYPRVAFRPGPFQAVAQIGRIAGHSAL